MPKVNNTKLSKALEVFITTLRPYVKDVISNAADGRSWEEALFNELNQGQQQIWNEAKSSLIKSHGNSVDLIDYYNLPTFGIRFKEAFIKEVGTRRTANKLINYFIELNEVRNKCTHFQFIEKDAVLRAFLNMKDSAKLLEMQDLYEELKKIEVGNEELKKIETGNEEQKRCDLEIRFFEHEKIENRPDVFGYELKTNGETYFLIFGYNASFAYCDLIADRVGQPLLKEDKLIREQLFDEKRTPKTQPSYLIKEFLPTTTKGEGKDFLDKILKILKEN